jgi:hypothetical protein
MVSKGKILVIMIIIIFAVSSFLPYLFMKGSIHIQLSKGKNRTIRLYPDNDGDILDDNIERNITFTSIYDPDSDNDFFPDGAEYNYWYKTHQSISNAVTKPVGDADGDGISNILDYDSDNDGVPDGYEVKNNLKPWLKDSNNDGISDRYHFLIYYNFEPSEITDRDHDNLPDNWENDFNIGDPKADPDGDGIDNFNEWMNGSNPIIQDERYGYQNTEDELIDSDGDNLADALESAIGLNPYTADTDDDGLLDGEEYLFWSLPFNPDTDGDNVSDGFEVQRGTSPYIVDSDTDLLEDSEELVTDPLRPDSDKNLILDGQEMFAHDIDRDGLETLLELDDSDGFITDPLNPDTDSDFIIDGKEDSNHNGMRDGNDPTDSTSDWDSGGETDPNRADTDGGGMDDGFEIEFGSDPLDPNDDIIDDPITIDPPERTPPKFDFEVDPFVCLVSLLIIIIILLCLIFIYYLTHLKNRFIEDVIEILETAEKVLYELDTGDSIRNAIYNVYRKFLEVMKNHKLIRKESMTVQEFAVVVRQNLPLPPGPLYGLTNVFEEARYSDHKLGITSKNRALKCFRNVRLDLANYQQKELASSTVGSIKKIMNTYTSKFHQFFMRSKKKP